MPGGSLSQAVAVAGIYADREWGARDTPHSGPIEVSGPWTKRGWAIKRGVDVVLSLAMLTVLSPLMLAIALLIKLTSKGPVIFRQARIGLNRRSAAQPPYVGRDRRKQNLGGRPFRIYKFRTMYADAPKYETKPSRSDDPRITPVGRFLRKTALDELPQFLNVLRGEMSLVGPRPEMSFIVARYGRREVERLRVKPGITGLWQLEDTRGAPIHENVQYDLYYIQNWSLWLDIKILLRTVIFLFFHGDRNL